MTYKLLQMTANSKSSLSTVMYSMTLLFMCHAASATQILLQESPSASRPSTKVVVPFKTSLRLSDNWNTGDTSVPKVTVTFINSSPHRLEFSLSSPLSSFVVEYKAAKASITPDTNWTTLKSYYQASPDVYPPSKPAATQTYSVLCEVPANSRGNTEYNVFGFPMAKEGYYRITAITRVSNVSELDGPAASPVVINTFTLDLRSNPIIVQRTPKGFVQVLPTTGKQPSAK